MIELDRIGDLCQRLALGTMATQVSHVADEAARDGLSFQEFFERGHARGTSPTSPCAHCP